MTTDEWGRRNEKRLVLMFNTFNPKKESWVVEYYRRFLNEKEIISFESNRVRSNQIKFFNLN